MTTILGTLIAFVIMGFLIGSIARRRGRPFGLWFFLGGLFGLLSLIVLLVMPRLEAGDYRGGGTKGQKTCPECHEWVDPNAVICPHCQTEL
ncbi:MAG: hypothetical protein HOF33_11100 [Rhodospirillaceae bacterium]|jgi:hypothetical protein|nr:hypothetical protein [Rhodospirillaceae bacterium]MBT7293272.1 hypothetical protein [Rhodospirillaceae bacterium]